MYNIELSAVDKMYECFNADYDQLWVFNNRTIGFKSKEIDSDIDINYSKISYWQKKLVSLSFYSAEYSDSIIYECKKNAKIGSQKYDSIEIEDNIHREKSQEITKHI